ncbi:hypothetical protein ESZ36_00390 [Colwellia demingiae]|uniref:Transcriptional regulator VspR n=1 Tax=Colwellia demingiae TaxID=89401 RepID=A0A5C6QSY9_9GAMM|nr:hypothetical protein [Colwellia demingiae]TWX71730.1 hypothetical protein ESZ36_00390 [Colwellia demingiae]
METIKLNKTFIKIISMPNINHFSAVEIRTAYIAVTKDEKLVPAEVRRFIYEELLKLERRGWIEKVTSIKRKVTRYSKTESFNFLESNELDFVKSKIIQVPTNSIKKEFCFKVNQYKKQLIEGLGSVEECLRLRGIYPELYTVLKRKHDILKEQNHMLIGKIKILDDLINQHKET